MRWSRQADEGPNFRASRHAGAQGVMAVVQPGEYADVLRAIGWSLDQRLEGRPVDNVEIAVRGNSLSVCWTVSGDRVERESYGPADVGLLRERARSIREGHAPAPGGEQAECLRTIGQYLDEHQIQLERLVTCPEGHRLTAVFNWHSLGQWFEPTAVQEMSAERRKLRGAGQQAATPPA